MKRTRLHALDPESARKRIKAAKSNKPFMKALLDRAHRGHKDAVDQWTMLHEAGFPDASDPSPTPPLGSVHSVANSEPGHRTESGRRGGSTQDFGRTSRAGAKATQAAASSRNTANSQLRAKRSDRRESPANLLVPDPENPLQVDPAIISSLSRRPDESESQWLERVGLELEAADVSLERVVIVREAILREIGFYDLGAQNANSQDWMSDADWRVLAILQNVPIDAWRTARPLPDSLRTEFERTGDLPPMGFLGPNGNIYLRMGNGAGHPIGNALLAIDVMIDEKRPRPVAIDRTSALPLLGALLPAGRGGGAMRLPLTAATVPRALQVIRSRRGTAAAGLAIGTSLGVAGTAATVQRGRSNMDQAPDVPTPPGLEPPGRPENDESFDEASIEVEWVPGFSVPEPDGPMVLIFPDVSEEIYRTLILEERRERQATRDQIDAIRDFYAGLHSDWNHKYGGRDKDGNQMQEYRIPGPGVAFKHPITGRPGDSRPGSIYVDLTFETPQGHVHIQTVDVDQDGLPTEQELKQARRIAEVTGRPVYVFPKIWQLEELERRNSDFFPIEVR